MPKSAMRSGSPSDDHGPFPPPAQTRERRVQQLVSLAEKEIERRLRDGTASPTETVAVMRLGTELEQVNIARIKQHTEYLEAQAHKARAETVKEELFTNAIEAMSLYRGNQDD